MTQGNSQADTIGAMVLAAGDSARFKSDKRVALMPDGRTLLATTLSPYLEAYVDVLLVLSENDSALGDDLRDYFGAPDNLDILLAPEAAEGMGGSLRAGANYIKALPRSWRMIFIALGDMPHVRRQTLAVLLERAKTLGDAVTDSILAPVMAHQQGHPVGIGGNFLPQLANCSGDTGAFALLQSEAAKVRQIELSDPGILADIDRPEDLA